MKTITINGHEYEFSPDHPNKIVVSPDGMLLIYVKKWKKKPVWNCHEELDGQVKKFWVTGIYTAPSKRMCNIEFDGKKYKCNGMTPAEVLELRSHLEACLALENLK